jgi:putative ABC transport system permease protein
LGFGGGLLGLLLAFWATRAIVARQLEGLRRLGLDEAIHLDGTVLAFALVITMCASVVAGLLPALRAGAEGLAGTLQSAGRGAMTSVRGQRIRNGLVVGQIALAVVLLHGAGLLVHSLIKLMSVDPGLRTERVLSFQFVLPPATYATGDGARAFFSDLLADVKQQPGVLSAGAISRLPIGQPGRFTSRFRVEGHMPVGGVETSIGVRIVTSDYFQTVGIPLLRGRITTDRDGASSPPVVVINEAAVREFFLNQEPLGRHLDRAGRGRVYDCRCGPGRAKRRTRPRASA